MKPDTQTTVSATTADWSREKGNGWMPGVRLLRSIRRYQNASGFLAPLTRRFAVLEHRFWSAVSGADIPLNANIAGGLLIPHPNGIVIHPDAQIGPNCLFMQQVTIGTNGTRAGLPTIGGHVDIGAGAKILGPITIGDHARIGANAVVIRDVPSGSTAVGIPGRIISDQQKTEAKPPL